VDRATERDRSDDRNSATRGAERNGRSFSPQPTRLDPAGGEGDDDHRKDDGDLGNVADRAHPDGDLCCGHRDEESEPDRCCPGAAAEFHVDLHTPASARRGPVVQLFSKSSRERSDRHAIARLEMTVP
jgi:hypothetical protein